MAKMLASPVNSLLGGVGTKALASLPAPLVGLDAQKDYDSVFPSEAPKPKAAPSTIVSTAPTDAQKQAAAQGGAANYNAIQQVDS